jgi:PAS domain S-box-containing protein
MKDQDQTKQQLICELEELRRRVTTLEASERRYRTIIDTVPLAIGEINRDGIIVFANAATEKLFGYMPEELVGKRAGDGIEPASAREAFRAWFCHTMLEQPPPSPVFARQVNKDGKQIDVRGDWNYLRNEKGEVVGQITVIADITDIKQAQEALADREARLLEAQEIANLGFVVVDLITAGITTSTVLDRICGIPVDYERTLDRWADLVHPDERQAMLDYLKEVVGDKKLFDREYRIVRYRDKQVRWVHGLGRLQFNADGQPTSMLGTVQDITDRKRTAEALKKAHDELEEKVRERTAELTKANEQLKREVEERRRAEEALRDSESRLTFALEVSNTGAWELDLVDHTAQRSLQHDRIFGYESLLPTWNYEMLLEHVVPEDREAVDRRFRQAVDSHGDWEFDCRIRRNDGKVRWIWAAGCPRSDNNGNPQRMTGIVQDITDRKQNEEALEQSERQFRNYFEQGLIGMGVTSTGKRWLLVNDRLCEILGYPREELVRKNWDEMTHPDDLEQNLQLFNRLLTGEIEHFTFDKRYLKKDGNVVQTTIHTRVFRKDDGTIDHVVVLVEDITAHKQAEEAVRQSHAELRAIYDGMADGLLVADIETRRFVRANASICHMLGYSQSELLSLAVKDLHPEADLPFAVGQFDALAEGTLSVSEEIPVLRKDGTVFYAVVSTSRVTYADRRCVVGFFRDVTERRRAAEVLRASEERYELAVRGAGVGIWDWNLRTGKVYYSPRWKILLGYDDEDIGDSVEDWAALLHPDERDWIIKFQDDFLAGTSPTVTVEYRLRHKDGSYRWIVAHGLAVRDNQGKAIRLVGSHGDITDRKRAEEALERERQSLWRMIQANDHERQLVAYDIHDGLAQYLAGARMQFQAHDALKATSPDEAAKAYETAVELVRQAHFESRRLISEVRPPVIDEDGLETAILHLVHEQRRRGGPQIECFSDVQFGRLLSILENALYRIAQEALSNACKHSKSKKVAVTLTQEGQEARLEIKDWGIGFDPQAVEKGHFGLEGIRQRVRLVGGRLTIESKPGSGTVVQVVVPIVESQNDG